MNIGYFKILPTNTDSHLITAIILSVTANDKQSKRTSLESLCCHTNHIYLFPWGHAAAAAKSLQSCPTLCNPIDGSSPGSTVPGILQARTLEWVAISFSNAWKWKVKVKLLSHVRLLVTPWTAAYRLLHPWDFPGKSTGVGCHCLLHEVTCPPEL